MESIFFAGCALCIEGSGLPIIRAAAADHSIIYIIFRAKSLKSGRHVLFIRQNIRTEGKMVGFERQLAKN